MTISAHKLAKVASRGMVSSKRMLRQFAVMAQWCLFGQFKGFVGQWSQGMEALCGLQKVYRACDRATSAGFELPRYLLLLLRTVLFFLRRGQGAISLI